jgi:hypothetical protein
MIDLSDTTENRWSWCGTKILQYRRQSISQILVRLLVREEDEPVTAGRDVSRA